MGFEDDFSAFAHFDISELQDQLDLVEAITAGNGQPRRSDGPTMSWSDSRIDALAEALLRDIPGGERLLESLRIEAKDNAHGVMAALASFSEVLKAVVRRLKRLPEELAGIIERFKTATAAVAKALGAASYSMSIDLPWSISVGFTWNPTRSAAAGSPIFA